MIMIILAIFILVGGIILITYSSDKAVKHTAHLARALGLSPLIIGVTVVSIGTDLSEIFNSIISCSLGHGDIDVGDSVGSDLTQLTLVFGLLPIITGAFYIHRKDIIILGSCEILSLLLIFSVVEKGYITRLNAIFMVGSLGIYIWLIYNANKESIMQRVEMIERIEAPKRKGYHLLIAIVGFVLGNSRYEAKKRGRIYERIDEHKDYSNATYTRKDMCQVLHKQIKDDLAEVKLDVKKLLQKNGIK